MQFKKKYILIEPVGSLIGPPVQEVWPRFDSIPV